MSGTTFSTEQFSAIYPEGIQGHYWNHARNMVVVDMLRHAKAKNILDVGAGAGIVTMYLKNDGWEVVGVEPAQMPQEKEAEGVIFYGKRAEDLPEDMRNKIDTVLLLDVIEHLEKPQDLIRSLEQVLPNLHNIVITVPARRELWSNYDVFNGHFKRYGRNDLLATMSGVGWRSLFVNYYFHLLYIPAWLMARMHVKRNTVISAPTGLMKIIHDLCAFVFYFEYKILPRRMYGSSVVAVFTK
ncbi:MAG: methyltransferase domain-containing protein [Candidatus Paceibacterota bacterium]|jgi:SAM-dependent methyltransferase